MSISTLLWFFALSGGTLAVLAVVAAKPLWRWRRVLASVAAALYLVAAVVVWGESNTPLIAALKSMTALFAMVYAVRVYTDRLHEQHVRHTTKVGVGILYLVGLLLFVSGRTFTDFDWLLMLASLGALGWAFVAVGQVTWAKKGYRRHEAIQKLPDNETPTITLAIPARNENHALTDFLQAAVVSDYPKLEIIVLDDCSQDRTSQIIRSFAHDGVRFVQGKEPASGWLGRNQALQTLAEHAHGDYIIFSGVDTHLSRDTISQIASFLVTHHIDMVSVMPMRKDAPKHISSFFQQLRYYWQVAMPATRFRTPVASSLWAIKTESLKNLGGFDAVRHKIIPEGSFARRLHPTDLYRFTISDDVIGVTTEKKWSSQAETALRLLYPTCKRQPVVVFGAVLALLAMVMPYAYAAWSLITDQASLLSLVAIGTSVLLSFGYMKYLRLFTARIWLSGLVTFPFLMVQEIVLLVCSMLLYEFGEVNWKGRNVCYPVIRPPAPANDK